MQSNQVPSLCAALAALSAAGAIAAPLPVDAALPSYEPRLAEPAAGARYLTPDGAIRIVGAEHAQTIIDGFDALYAKTHPGTHFAPVLRGTATAMPALTHGVSAFAPMGRGVDHVERVPYKKIVGAEPLEIRVAHASHRSQKSGQTIAIYVNKANPIEHLTMEQVTRIFTTGHAKGDLSDWGQLGLKGDWARRAIHPYGTPEYTGFGSYMEQQHVGGLPFGPNHHQYPNSPAIVKHVGADATGIGFASISFVGPDVKVVALADKEGGAFSSGSVEDAVSGKYPLRRFLYFYVRRTPGQPIDPLVKEYLRLVLSKQGQQIIAAEEDTYVPLSAAEAAAELEKLK